MTKKSQLSGAELRDRIAVIMAILVCVVSLVYATSAASHFVNAAAQTVLGGLERSLALLAVGLVIFGAAPLAFRAKRAAIQDSSGLDEGFVSDATKKAFAESWGLTLILLIILDIVASDLMASVPGPVASDLIRAILLGTFGVCFFLQTTGRGRSSHAAP